MSCARPVIEPVCYKLIDGFPDYRAGDDGSYWSRRAFGPGRDKNPVEWRLMATRAVPDGYCHVRMFNGLTSRQVSLAVLILETFVGPRPPGMQACHNDGNRANNRLDNLRWDTAAGNNADKVSHGTWQGGEKNGRAKLTEDDIREIRRLRDSGATIPVLGRTFGVTPTMVGFIVRRQSWKHVT